MSQDQIMQVMLVAFVTKYARASMSSISSLASMLSQLPAFVRTKRKRTGCIESFQLQLSSVFFWGYSLNEYKLKARNNLQFKAHKTNHVVLCLML